MAGSLRAEVSLMLTCLEIPTVYIDLEKQNCFALISAMYYPIVRVIE